MCVVAVVVADISRYLMLSASREFVAAAKRAGYPDRSLLNLPSDVLLEPLVSMLLSVFGIVCKLCT